MRDYMIIWAFTTFVVRTDSAITCDAPAVERGYPANITCHFDTDIGRRKAVFGIDRFKDSDSPPQVVLRCYWPVKNSTVPKCTNKEGYSYDLVDERNLNLQIASTTKEYVGKYVCFEMASAKPSKYCTLSLKNVTDNAIPQMPCDAPEVARGSPANITCHFNNDVGRAKIHFGIDRYKGGHREVLLRCYWPNKNSSVPKCTHKGGFLYNLVASPSLTLQIPLTTEDNVGRYVCQELASDEPFESCKIMLGQNVTEAPVKEGSVDIIVIVLPILGVALIVIAILAYLRIRKRSKQGNTSKQDDGNDNKQDIETAPDQPECDEEALDTFSDSTSLIQQPSTGNTDSSLSEASAGNEATSNTPSPAFVQTQDIAETWNQETRQPSTATSYDDDEDEEAIKEKYDRVMLELKVKKENK